MLNRKIKDKMLISKKESVFWNRKRKKNFKMIMKLQAKVQMGHGFSVIKKKN